MRKWHSNLTPAEKEYDNIRSWCVKEYGEEYALRILGRRFSVDTMIKLLSMDHDESVISRLELNDFVAEGVVCLDAHATFEKFGRPTYLVSRDLFETCLEFKISAEDVEYAFETIPYPCFAFCFERGCMIEFGGLSEIETTFICRSKGMVKILGKMFPSEDVTGDEVLNDRTTCVALFSDYSAMTTSLGSHHPDVHITSLDRLIAALMLLWQSRPEFVVLANLPRSERYEFRGSRDNIRTWKFPDKLIIRKPSDTDQTSTGRHYRAHWRAGHFQHYRHERYSRHPDGSVKKTFVPPVIVHADEIEGRPA